MEKNKQIEKMNKEVQEAINKIEVNKPEEMGKKKQKISTSFTLKSYANNIKKLEEVKMITHEEAETLRHIYKKMVERWVSIEMTL